MGCSKLLNPQSDQFYLTQTKEGLSTCKKKKKKNEAFWGWVGRECSKEENDKGKPGEAKVRMCWQPEEIN